MDVKVFSIDELCYELEKGNIDLNYSIISFSDSPNEDIDFNSFNQNIDFICIHFPDLDYCDRSEEELNKLFFEVDELICFIKSRAEKGRDFICQCYEGHSRSSATAAAILEHYEKRGDVIFNNPRYQPNSYLYKKLIEELLLRT